ncbi:MAG: metal-dependent transcriptional regulator [Actinomycetaceae bacterium]|nr:metal-dependent transcriptional regulator [Actinomycetaceae bacterium]
MTTAPKAPKAPSAPKATSAKTAIIDVDDTGMPFSHVIQDYLKIIYTNAEWEDSPTTVTALAQHLQVAASTASETVKRLVDAGFITHERYGGITLTEQGRDIALRMVRRHRLIETYLLTRLDYEWDEVHAEAESLEHAVSSTFIERIAETLGHPTRDPHGDPIPAEDGTVLIPAAVKLSELAINTPARVVRIADSQPALLRHLEDRGLVLDATVEVAQGLGIAGTYTLTITPPKASISEGGLEKTASTKDNGDSPIVREMTPVLLDAVWVTTRI